MTSSGSMRLALAALFVAMTGVGVATADSLEVMTARGVVSVPANPRTVAVFDLGALDTLDMLGVKVSGVPGSHVPNSLAKYRGEDFAKVGTLFEPDYEAVNALAPDLIIVGARSAAKFDDLARIAPTIDLTSDAHDYVASIERNATTLGHIFGKEKEVAEAIAHLDASVGALREVTADIGTGLVLLTTGGKVSAYGPGSRFGQLHDRYGIKPADPKLDVATHGQAISYEYILQTNPDWLFVIDRDAAIGQTSGKAAARLLDNELVAETKAWKAGRVIYLDPVKMYLTSTGLRAEQQIVDELAAAIGKVKSAD